MDNFIGIYTTELPIMPNLIRFNFKGTIEKKECGAITDTPLSVYDICENIKAYMYKCNMTHYFLSSSKKIPIMYINICYTKYPMRIVLLCRLLLYFIIDNTDNISSIDDLISKYISGKFVLESIICEKQQVIEIYDSISNENDKLNNNLINLSKSLEMVELLKDMAKETEEKLYLDYGEKLKEFINVPKATHSLVNNNPQSSDE